MNISQSKIIQHDFNSSQQVEEAIQRISSKCFGVMPFHRNLLPEPLSSWVLDEAYRASFPPDYMAVSVMASLSILVSSKYKIKPKVYDDWFITPNLWGLAIGEPSIGKSSMLNSGINFLKKLDLHKAQQSTFLTNDTTIEKLGIVLSEQDHGIMVVRDEFSGWLRNLSKRGRENDKAFYLEAFNGNSSYRFDRLSRKSTVINELCVSLLGGLQPSWIRSLFDPDSTNFVNDGFIQRFQLAVWPDPFQREFIDQKPNYEIKQDIESIFEKIYENIQVSETRILGLSENSYEMFKDFFHENQRAMDQQSNDLLQEHFGKFDSLVCSIALIIQVFKEPESTEVDEVSFQFALDWIDYLKSHALKIYSAGNKLNVNGAITLIKNVSKLPKEFSVRHIQQKGWKDLSNQEEIKKAIIVLNSEDLIFQVDDSYGVKNKGRPKSPSYSFKFIGFLNN